jgi:hypothetical protein
MAVVPAAVPRVAAGSAVLRMVATVTVGILVLPVALML